MGTVRRIFLVVDLIGRFALLAVISVGRNSAIVAAIAADFAVAIAVAIDIAVTINIAIDVAAVGALLVITSVGQGLVIADALVADIALLAIIRVEQGVVLAPATANVGRVAAVAVVVTHLAIADIGQAPVVAIAADVALLVDLATIADNASIRRGHLSDDGRASDGPVVRTLPHTGPERDDGPIAVVVPGIVAEEACRPACFTLASAKPRASSRDNCASLALR